MPDNQVIAFIHAPKCGGMSLQKVFEATWGSDRFLRITSQHLDDLENIVRKNKRTAIGFGGHFTYEAISRCVPNITVKAVTLLRDPTDRCLSLYKYSRITPQAPGHNDAARLSAAEFFKKYKSLVGVRFVYCQFLGNAASHAGAIDNIERNFSYVLRLDQIRHGQQILHDDGLISLSPFPHVNASGNDLDDTETEACREILADVLADDYRVYEYFDRRVRTAR